jgi:hypothetical protein
MMRWSWLVKIMDRLSGIIQKILGKKPIVRQEKIDDNKNQKITKNESTGTFIEKLNAEWLRKELSEMEIKILVWRSVSVRFLRAVIHSWLGGKIWLKLLFELEERNPEYYGENGQYPLVVIRKK